MLKALTVLTTMALAGGGLWIIVAELRRVTHAQAWPTVTGHVLRSSSSADQGDSGPATYDVRVMYQYSVSGLPCVGSKVILGPAWSLAKAREKGEELRSLYPVGRELPIAYNAKRPAQSEIADDYQKAANSGLILLGFILFGLFSYLTYYAITGL